MMDQTMPMSLDCIESVVTKILDRDWALVTIFGRIHPQDDHDYLAHWEVSLDALPSVHVYLAQHDFIVNRFDSEFSRWIKRETAK